MNFRDLIFLIGVVLLLVSCEEEKQNVHFHGRIVVECNNQVHTKLQTVYIHRDFDTGTSGQELLGQTTTDENGFYSMYADVSKKGDFRSYVLNIYGPTNNNVRHFVCQAESYIDTKDVEINANATPSLAYGFHIKNEFPFDNNDFFDNLKTEIAFGNNSNTIIISNLTGMYVDTIIYRFYLSHPVEYSYSFVKNGVSQVIPIDTITNTTCLDTTIVEISY